MKPFVIRSATFALLLIVLILPQALATPQQDDDLATAGLKPFTPETNNRSLTEFKRLLHPLKPDLVITKVVIFPQQPKVGELIGVTLYYKNIGGKPAKNFYLRQEPGTLGKGGVGLGGDYAHLAPGEEKQYSWGGLKATKAGSHTLTFSIDPENSVEESNEKNNLHSVRVRIIGP